MSDSRKTILALGILSVLIGAALALMGGHRDMQLAALGLILLGAVLVASGWFFGRP